MIAHPIFPKRLVDFKSARLASWVNGFLSRGGVCYYLAGEGIETRLHFYNYFSLLKAAPFHATWKLRLYTPDGSRFIETSGEFTEPEVCVVELGPLVKTLGACGLCVAYLDPNDHGRTFRQSYGTIFFTEYYTGDGSGFIHSLGNLTPKLYQANDYLVTSAKADAEQLLIISNSCDRAFRTPRVLKETGLRFEIRNTAGAMKTYVIDPIAPRACRKIRLFEMWPDLESFLDKQPGLLRLRGPNILYSPLFIQTKRDHFFTSEHFQGLDWEEL